MRDDIADRPNSFPLPPVLLVCFLLLSFLVARTGSPLALAFDAPGWLQLAGWALIALALAFDTWAIITFRHHKTNVMPTAPALSLVTDGPFSISRNPIYVGNVVLLAGFGLVGGVGLLFLLAALNVLLLDRFQIRQEEAHLAARFGEAWHAYARRVRRWL